MQRYVRRLDEQETRLEVLLREGAALVERREAARSELERLVAALTLDAGR